MDAVLHTLACCVTEDLVVVDEHELIPLLPVSKPDFESRKHSDGGSNTKRPE